MSSSERSEMRPFADLAPFSEVRRLLGELGRPVQRTETVALSASTGRGLAVDLTARVDVPNADRAAMDGFAAHSDDTAAGASYRVVGRVAAGQAVTAALEPGECIEIATGAPLPPGADCVVPVEKVVIAGADITLCEDIQAGQHVSRRADDLRAGEVLASAGTAVQPSLIAACAAAGLEVVEVWSQPRVLIVASGDEVMPVGSGPLRPGQVYDSNACALTALFEQAGAQVERSPVVGDDPEQLRRALDRPDFDLVVTIGGTSVGRRDLVADVVGELGEVHLHGAAVRPGKPLMLATLGSRPLIGLPGFPTSCLMMAYVTALPLIARLRRIGEMPVTRSARLGTAVESPAGKTHFLPVRIDAQTAVPTFTFSSAVSSMARASGWIEVPAAETRLPAGSPVEVFLY